MGPAGDMVLDSHMPNVCIPQFSNLKIILGVCMSAPNFERRTEKKGMIFTFPFSASLQQVNT